MSNLAVAEKHMHDTYTEVVQYLSKALATSSHEIEAHIQAVFPTWNHLWQELREWLQEQTVESLRDKFATILGFAQKIPDFEQHREQFQNAIVLDENFWNKVHTNLCLAKYYLSC